MSAFRNAGDVLTAYASNSPLATPEGAQYLPGGITIDATAGYDGSNTGYETLFRAGCVMALNTSSKKYVPAKRTLANGAGSSTASLVVDNSAFFKAGDALQIGSTTGTISSIDYTTHTITLTATKTWSDNDVVYCTTNGTGTAVGVLAGDVDCYQDDTRTSADSPGQLLVAGFLKASRLLGDYTAIMAVSGNAISANFKLDTSY